MRIGITEQGDAGLDLSWVQKLNTVDGAVIITKNLTEKCKNAILTAHGNGHKLILHLGCTGWGKSPVEPNVPYYTEQIDRCMNLIQNGFPIKQVVLRIDPIIPTKPGLDAMTNVLNYALKKYLLPEARVRISVLDEYKHVKKRLTDAGYSTFYPGTNFQASAQQFRAITELLKLYRIKFRTCAEAKLTDPNVYLQTGCISKEDLDILGIPMPEKMSVNGQNRNGCKCLTCKTELLSQKKQCPNGCLYCYWRN